MDLNYILIMKVPFFLLGFALYMICCRIKKRDPDEDDLIVPQPPSSIYVIPMREEGEQVDEDEHISNFYSLPPYSELPPYNSQSTHCPPAYSQADAPPPPYTEDYQPPVEQC